jgi:hypothetical protein
LGARRAISAALTSRTSTARRKLIMLTA